MWHGLSARAMRDMGKVAHATREMMIPLDFGGENMEACIELSHARQGGAVADLPTPPHAHPTLEYAPRPPVRRKWIVRSIIILLIICRGRELVPLARRAFTMVFACSAASRRIDAPRGAEHGDRDAVAHRHVSDLDRHVGIAVRAGGRNLAAD